MRILGINCLNHDAAVSVIEDGDIKFAAHSERYSRKKNDPFLNDGIMDEALSHGQPDVVAYFERPWLKKSRQLYAGQYDEVFQTFNTPKQYLKRWIGDTKIQYVQHHESHASAGYYTSPFDEACIVVIDAIGEWETVTIWYGNDDKLEKRWSQKYPKSLGLFYSAMTQRLDLKPQEDEYILMGMDAWGNRDEKIKNQIHNDLVESNINLHKGCRWWDLDFYPDDGSEQWKFDIASNTQWVCEDEIMKIMNKAKEVVPESRNLVFMGGVALNCVANEKVAKEWDDIWIMPNPGDAGSSLGCAARVYGRKINWEHTFLGTNIKGSYPVKRASDLLIQGELIGIANGRAEFGPRALGNRSLIADPRGNDIKDRMNVIKKRQKFRPFAPSVLEEHAHEIFELPVKKASYMQFTAKCKFPDLYPAICHVDGTSRVQTINRKENRGYYDMIKRFYDKTGCPMVLNTSLNIKGQPIVNTKQDGKDFEKHYGVKVL
jgi:carbamoyltransferase